MATGKSDPRVTRTRKLIEEAFTAALAQKGFEELSVQDVAERAGINRVTFYSHFPDKYALLSHSIRQSFGRELEERKLLGPGLLQDWLSPLFVAVCEYVAAIHDHCKPPHDHLDWLLETVVKELAAEVIVRRLAGSPLGASGDRELAAHAASSAIYGLALRWIRRARRGSAERFVASTLHLVAGIVALDPPDGGGQ